MRIDRLELQNFKKFAEQTFEFPISSDAATDAGSFHVLIGENGVGKTSILDGIAVALGVWLEKVPDSLLVTSRRRLTADQKHLTEAIEGDRTQIRQAPGDMSIYAKGRIQDHSGITWGQSLRAGTKNVTNAKSKMTLKLISEVYAKIQRGERVLLPIISYYGAGRAWMPHNQRKQLKAKSSSSSNRWEAFYDCLNDRIRLSDLNSWFRSEAIERGNRRGRYRTGFEVVLKAILGCVPGADGLYYDSDREEIVLSIDGNSQPFSNLSAGQRSLFALVADIAVKMVTQNNFLVPAEGLGPEDGALPRVLEKTPGVVLIDELDVHLHPKWQRGIVQNLRTVFPSIQFITTTHSPFIVQSLRSYELINLQGQSGPELRNLSVEEIAKGLMGVNRPEVGEEYEKMVKAAKSYLVMLDEAKMAPPEKLTDFELRLAKGIAPYADNPAFQAFLELKHAAKLGTIARSSNGADEKARL